MPILRFIKADKNKYEALYPNIDGIGHFSLEDIGKYITLSKTQKKKFELLEKDKEDVISLRLKHEEGARLIRSMT